MVNKRLQEREREKERVTSMSKGSKIKHVQVRVSEADFWRLTTYAANLQMTAAEIVQDKVNDFLKTITISASSTIGPVA